MQSLTSFDSAPSLTHIPVLSAFTQVNTSKVALRSYNHYIGGGNGHTGLAICLWKGEIEAEIGEGMEGKGLTLASVSAY